MQLPVRHLVLLAAVRHATAPRALLRVLLLPTHPARGTPRGAMREILPERRASEGRHGHGATLAQARLLARLRAAHAGDEHAHAARARPAHVRQRQVHELHHGRAADEAGVAERGVVDGPVAVQDAADDGLDALHVGRVVEGRLAGVGDQAGGEVLRGLVALGRGGESLLQEPGLEWDWDGGHDEDDDGVGAGVGGGFRNGVWENGVGGREDANGGQGQRRRQQQAQTVLPFQ